MAHLLINSAIWIKTALLFNRDWANNENVFKRLPYKYNFQISHMFNVIKSISGTA